ncbi:MAG: PEGA domain-containing protein [Kofleriaceae bacterium]|nr:PEGA domain-containing protein [Kofleriaceae bacterium]
MRRFLVFWLAAFLLFAGGAAFADDVDALIKQGVALMAKRDYVAAMDVFRRAHEIAPSPRTFAQIGFVHMAMARWVEAEDQLLQAIAEREDKWARRNRAVLEDSLRKVRDHLGYLEVAGQPAGAEVRVDGELVGLLPLRRPLRMAVGDPAVIVTAPGHEKFQGTTHVTAGETARMRIDLKRVQATLAVPPATPVLASGANAGPSVDATSSAHPVHAAGPERPVRRLGVALAIAGAVAVAAGVPILLATNKDNLGAGLAGAGGAALLMGGAFLWASSSDEPQPRVAVGIGPSQVNLAFRF